MLSSRNTQRNLDTTDWLNSTWTVDCSHSPVTIWNIAAFTTFSFLVLLPLYIWVIVLGCQRWRKPSVSPAAPGHSDVFTYNMVALELVQIFECVCLCVGQCVDLPWVMMESIVMIFKTFCVKILFPMLTCMELFAAVVHPVAYLRLRTSGGVRVRNLTTSCVWLLCGVWVVSGFLRQVRVNTVLYFFLVAWVLLVVSFCCLSVLWTLKRPGPGHHLGVRQRVDQSKLRAFHTIATIMAVLWLSLGGVLVFDAIQTFRELAGSNGCVSALCAGWMSLPTSFVLPVMFLQRAGKLPSGRTQNRVRVR